VAAGPPERPTLADGENSAAEELGALVRRSRWRLRRRPAVQEPAISQRLRRHRQSRAIQLSQPRCRLRWSGGGYLAPDMGIWSLFASVGSSDCEHPRCALT
jgi:hypothetical protein